MWRNLMALKQGGRAHDAGGVDETTKGELMVECPACPHPGRNLPDDWEKVGPLLAYVLIFCPCWFIVYIYNQILICNLHSGGRQLQAQRKGTSSKRRGTHAWMGAYVIETDYKNHIATYVDQSEVSELFLQATSIQQLEGS